jgi:hypothetical protein
LVEDRQIQYMVILIDRFHEHDELNLV